jgi:hypothetical protein
MSLTWKVRAKVSSIEIMKCVSQLELFSVLQLMANLKLVCWTEIIGDEIHE